MIYYLESLDKGEIEKTMRLDEENLKLGLDPLLSYFSDEKEASERVLASNLLQTNSSKTLLKPLPYPLSLLSKREKVRYVTDQAMMEAREKHNNPFIKLDFGNPDFRPSFWLEDDWPWEMCKTSIHRVTEEMFTGQGTLSGFLERSIRHLLISSGKDPETFVCGDVNKKTMAKKVRMRNSMGWEARSNLDALKLELEDKEDEEMGVLKDTMNEQNNKQKVENHVEISETNQVMVTTNDEEELPANALELEATADDPEEEEISLEAEDNSPMSITIRSKGHKPIEITFNQESLKKRPRNY
jgi:hypothetical protein